MRGLVGREVDSNGAMNGQLGEGGLFQEDCVLARGLEHYFITPLPTVELKGSSVFPKEAEIFRLKCLDGLSPGYHFPPVLA